MTTLKIDWQHPVMQALKTGEWVTRCFGWFYMMVSRLAGPTMTIAVGYLIIYAIDSHHGLASIPRSPSLWDGLAALATGIINVAPELVFPGTVVLCIQAFHHRRWLDGLLYLLASTLFAVLTIMLLQAFESNHITDAFLSMMLLWRAISALFYTVVAELCSHHRQVPESPEQQAVHALAAELAQVQEQRTEQVNLLNQVNSELKGVQSQVHLNVEQEVQKMLDQLPHLIQEQVNHALVDRSPTTQSGAHRQRQGAVNSAAKGSLLPTDQERVNPESEPKIDTVNLRSELGKGAQVQRFIREQQARSHRTPTLEEIMVACQCSKNTAIRHRRLVLREHRQTAGQPKLTIVKVAGNE